MALGAEGGGGVPPFIFKDPKWKIERQDAETERYVATRLVQLEEGGKTYKISVSVGSVERDQIEQWIQQLFDSVQEKIKELMELFDIGGKTKSLVWKTGEEGGKIVRTLNPVVAQQKANEVSEEIAEGRANDGILGAIGQKSAEGVPESGWTKEARERRLQELRDIVETFSHEGWKERYRGLVEKERSAEGAEQFEDFLFNLGKIVEKDKEIWKQCLEQLEQKQVKYAQKVSQPSEEVDVAALQYKVTGKRIGLLDLNSLVDALGKVGDAWSDDVRDALLQEIQEVTGEELQRKLRSKLDQIHTKEDFEAFKNEIQERADSLRASIKKSQRKLEAVTVLTDELASLLVKEGGAPSLTIAFVPPVSEEKQPTDSAFTTNPTFDEGEI